MDGFDWTQFLREWNDYVQASPLAEELPPDVRASGSIVFPPAIEHQIAAEEGRLGIALPPSFRAFLRVSNGLQRVTHTMVRLWGTEELSWFRAANREWIAAFAQPSIYGPEPEVPDEEYFSYGQWVEHFRRSHLKETLQISEAYHGAVCLLNPQVISKDGEWEAWFFANWLPGAHRYRSFLEMMKAEFHRFAGREWKQPVGVVGALPDEYTGSPGNVKRRIKKRRKPHEEKVLGKPLKAWSVDELLAMLERSDYDIIHGEVIVGLGKLGDRRAIEPLMKRLREDSNVCAMHALKSLAPERLPEPLLEILQRRDPMGFHAAAALLAELNEPRAVPLIVEALQDLRPESSHLNECVGQHLVSFGEAGFDALIGLLPDDRADVRRRAASALMYASNTRAADAIQQLLHDPDPGVRQTVEIALKVLPAQPRRECRRDNPGGSR